MSKSRTGPTQLGLLGKYRLLRELGRGATGTVYLAQHEAGHQLAIKVLGAEFNRDNEFVERFRREGQIGARLKHPHIVQVFEAGFVDGLYYIAMDYLGSTNLKQLAARTGGKLPQDQAVGLTDQLLDALAHAHSRDVVHRDLKPANVMITSRGEACLTDFSIARLQSSSKLTRTGMCLGTPQYMAPEQFDGAGIIDHRADLYALGVMLYEMLTGVQPFAGQELAQVLKAQLLTRPEHPSQLDPAISEGLGDVVLKALEKVPWQRFQSAEHMRGALKARHLASSPESEEDTQRLKRVMLEDRTPAVASEESGEYTLYPNRPALIEPSSAPEGVLETGLELVIRAPERTWAVPVTSSQLTIGGLGSDIFLLREEGQASLAFQDGQLHLFSTRATAAWVNDKPCRNGTLSEGDELRLGPSRLMVRRKQQPPAAGPQSLWLESCLGPYRGHRWCLDQESLIITEVEIGRDPVATAVVAVEGSQLVCRTGDLPTTLNAEPVGAGQSRPVKDGDLVQVGPHLLKVRSQSESTPTGAGSVLCLDFRSQLEVSGLTQVYQALNEVIESQFGEILPFLGDSLLVVFRAHDHAVKAVNAALQSLARLLELDADLAAAAAIHSGYLGDGAPFEVHDDCFWQASRLSRFGLGERTPVLITGATWELLGDRFSTRLVRLADWQDPTSVDTYAVLAKAAAS